MDEAIQLNFKSKVFCNLTNGTFGKVPTVRFPVDRDSKEITPRICAFQNIITF